MPGGEEAGPLRAVMERLLLFRLPNRSLDIALTATAALVVIWSRFAFLADGPWEWDETLFARGILYFELAAHFPHPPGFPGWIAIGRLLTVLTGDPLMALQLASAAFSVAALWVLAALGRKVAPPPVAVAAALVVLAAPGPWLFAVRGFTSTAAAVLALGAAAVAAGGLEGRRPTVFTLLLTASFLVRPNILPVRAVLGLGVAWGVRPRRRLLPGAAVGLAAVALASGLMVRAEGSWSAFIAPFLSHSRRHFSRLASDLGGFADLGLVKGFGGAIPTFILLLLTAVGVVVWARRAGRWGAWLWVTVLAVAVVQLVWMQNRTYCRYAVGVQMAVAPLVAGAAAAAPPAVACTGLLALAGWLGVGSMPLLEEQHTTQLAGWRAVRRAQEVAARSGGTVVVEPELHPFASYLWHLLERRGAAVPPRVLSPWDPGPWVGLEGSYLVATIHRPLYPGSLYGKERHFGGVSAALWPLTQQRFLEAWVIEGAPLPLEGWWPAERQAGGRPFMWGGASAELLLPPLPEGTEVVVSLRPAPGPEPLVVELNGREMARLDGEGGELQTRLEISRAEVGAVSLLRFNRSRGYVPGHGDSRPLAVQLFELRAFGPALPWGGAVAHPWQREALRVELEGAYDAERFSEEWEGVWLRPRARLTVPGGEGRLILRLGAPRPAPPRPVILVGGRKVAGPLELGPQPEEVEFRLWPDDCEGGRVQIEIVSDRYVPADSGGEDERELGVVLSGVFFEPRGGSP